MPAGTSAAHISIADEEQIVPGAYRCENGRLPAPATELNVDYRDGFDFAPPGDTRAPLTWILIC